MILRLLVICILTILGAQQASGQQNALLAKQYYQSGEFEKAAGIYKQLMKKNDRNNYYFDRYLDCLIQLEDYDAAEKEVRAKIKRYPESIAMYVKQGQILIAQNRIGDAEKIFKEGIKRLSPDRMEVIQLATEFVKMNEFDLAETTYQKGIQMLKDPSIFAYNLGDLYRQKGDKQQMIVHFLSALDNQSARIENVQLLFDRYLETEDEWNLLRDALLNRIQEDPGNMVCTEMLAWFYIQRRSYEQALRQYKAIDARMRENGSRVFELANIASNAKDYSTAIDAFEYIINAKGESSTYYIDAYKALLRTKRDQLTNGYSYEPSELESLDAQYEAFLKAQRSTAPVASIYLDHARLQAYYLGKLDRAIDILETIKNTAGIPETLLARIKIDLADFYLIKGERWESTLLYSQVDKMFRDDYLGELARFKNARLSYFMGDFSWAQSQFDVLKSSTSKLISNDALDLSVFITDNLGLDTSTAIMEAYAQTELLIFQNKLDEADRQLKELSAKFWDHDLTDDILYAQAQIAVKKKDFEEAISLLEKVVVDFSEDIRADNSLYQMAELYENQLNKPEKAKELYEKLFIEMSGSTFAVEARKKYRKLRGDAVQ